MSNCCEKIGYSYEGSTPEGYRAGPCDPCPEDQDKCVPCCSWEYIPGYHCDTPEVSCCPTLTGGISAWERSRSRGSWRSHHLSRYPESEQNTEFWLDTFAIDKPSNKVLGYGGWENGGLFETTSETAPGSWGPDTPRGKVQRLDPWTTVNNGGSWYGPSPVQLNMGIISIPGPEGPWVSDFGRSAGRWFNYFYGLKAALVMTLHDSIRCTTGHPNGTDGGVYIGTKPLGTTQDWTMGQTDTLVPTVTHKFSYFTTQEIYSAPTTTVVGQTTTHTTGNTDDGQGGFRITTYTSIVDTYDVTITQWTDDWETYTDLGTQSIMATRETLTPKLEPTPTYTMTETCHGGDGTTFWNYFWEPAMTLKIDQFFLGADGHATSYGGNLGAYNWNASQWLFCTNGTDYVRLGQTGDQGDMPDWENGFTKGWPLNSGHGWRWASEGSLRGRLRDLFYSDIPTVPHMSHEDCRTLNWTPSLETTTVSGVPWYGDVVGTGRMQASEWRFNQEDLGGTWDPWFDAGPKDGGDGLPGTVRFSISGVDNTYSWPPTERFIGVEAKPQFFGDSLCPEGATERECAALYAATYCTHTGSISDTRGGVDSGETNFSMATHSCCEEGQSYANDYCVENCENSGINKIGFLSQKSQMDAIQKYIEDNLGAGYRLVDYTDFFDLAPENSCVIKQTHNGGSLNNNLQDFEHYHDPVGWDSYNDPQRSCNGAQIGYTVGNAGCWGIRNCGCCNPITGAGVHTTIHQTQFSLLQHRRHHLLLLVRLQQLLLL